MRIEKTGQRKLSKMYISKIFQNWKICIFLLKAPKCSVKLKTNKQTNSSGIIDEFKNTRGKEKKKKTFYSQRQYYSGKM